MQLPKVLSGVIITGATAVSVVFPQNSFAHKIFSQYFSPSKTQVASVHHTVRLHNLTKISPTPIISPTATPTSAEQNFPTSSIYLTPAPAYKSQAPTTTSVPTLVPTSVPAQSNSPAPTNDVQGFIMNAINDFRHSQGLSSVQTNSYTCNFAATRAQEITTNFSHDGFTSRVNSKTLPYPSYSFVTENLAQTGNYKDVVNMWIASPGHNANLRADTPYVCVVQAGDYYAMEGWKP